MANHSDPHHHHTHVFHVLPSGAYCRLFGRHLDTDDPVPYNDAHWRNVVAVLGLSKEQVGGGGGLAGVCLFSPF